MDNPAPLGVTPLSFHLPRYDELYQAFKTQGIDEIACACVSVNDTFEVSDADTALAYLKGEESAGVSAPVKALEG